MRRMFALAIIFAALTWTGQVRAVATPSATTQPNKQVEDLKERLATRVAELRQTQKKAIAGKVKNVSVSTITVETKTKDIKIELPDEIIVIQYLKGVRTKLSSSDIDTGDTVIVFGDYDATVDILKASVIIIQNTVTARASGTITAIDKTDFTLTVLAADGKSYVIDIETTTKALAWGIQQGIQKGGFSKMTVGNTIHVLGTPVANKDNRISAIRIFDLGNLTAAAGAQAPSASPTPTGGSSPTKSPTPTP
ncbi:hypothetical protein HYV22_01145 [Candidatus Gottesmanbacteria bacterium]|nr:hypothetical protein [Candidatus Gottesmanbacteria bacterium]